MPCEPDNLPRAAPPKPRGYTGLPNPAQGQTLVGTPDDRLAGFSRRPLDRFQIPGGGRFLDPLRDEPHYGVDYTYADDYLHDIPMPVHPIGPGYVTARSSCLMCFVEGDRWGRTTTRKPYYNHGYGTLVILETPYTPEVSIYTMYAHLGIDYVSLGDYVTPDDVIGLAGATGYADMIHVHLEVRFGPPGRFWNADFAEWDVRDRWLATLFVDPALAVFPENHSLLAGVLNNYLLEQPRPVELP
jgi:hypothetical protein